MSLRTRNGRGLYIYKIAIISFICERIMQMTSWLFLRLEKKKKRIKINLHTGTYFINKDKYVFHSTIQWNQQYYCCFDI